jgi:hypothetical protein
VANTYEAISTVTVGSGGSANMTFSSIPATYTDLLVKVSARGNTSALYGYLFMRLNGATTNYSGKILYGDNATAGSAGNSSASHLNPGLVTMATATASTFASSEFYIPNYRGANVKPVSSDAVGATNTSYAMAYLAAQLWSDSAAITTITLTPDSGNFVQYSTATLYGIKSS